MFGFHSAYAVILTPLGPKIWIIMSGQAARAIDTTSRVSRGKASVIPDGSVIAD